jgi:hypothetical protein
LALAGLMAACAGSSAAAHPFAPGRDIWNTRQIRLVVPYAKKHWRIYAPSTHGVPAGCVDDHGRAGWGIHAVSAKILSGGEYSPPANFGPIKTDGCHTLFSPRDWNKLKRLYRQKSLIFGYFAFFAVTHEEGHLILTRNFHYKGDQHKSRRGGGIMRSRPRANCGGRSGHKWRACNSLIRRLRRRGFH